MPKANHTLKSAAHIRTARHIKGFRSARMSTGVPMEALDGGRIRFEYERLTCRKRHRC